MLERAAPAEHQPNRKIVDVKSVKPYRSPSQARQWRIALIVVVLVAVLVTAAYVLIGPRQDTYTLRGYESAVVVVGQLTQTTQASGTVVFPVQMSLSSPEEGYAARLLVAEGDRVTGQAA